MNCSKFSVIQTTKNQNKQQETKFRPAWTAIELKQNWLVVSTHLKNISQIGSFPQVLEKIPRKIMVSFETNCCKLCVWFLLFGASFLIKLLEIDSRSPRRRLTTKPCQRSFGTVRHLRMKLPANTVAARLVMTIVGMMMMMMMMMMMFFFLSCSECLVIVLFAQCNFWQVSDAHYLVYAIATDCHISQHGKAVSSPPFGCCGVTN